MYDRTTVKLSVSLIVLVALSAFVTVHNNRKTPLSYIEPQNYFTLPINENKPIREYIQFEARQNGLSESYIFKLIDCESKWNDKAISRTKDYGLWQINQIHGLSREQMFNPYFATKWSIEKRLRDGSWDAWTCNRKIK